MALGALGAAALFPRAAIAAPRRIRWADLIPPGVGYMIPLAFSGEGVTEFVLVPFVGACIHVPPPPNQLVFVMAGSPFPARNLWDAPGISRTCGAEGRRSAIAQLFNITLWLVVPRGTVV